MCYKVTMKVIELIKDFWKDNKYRYFITSGIVSFLGIIVYAMTDLSPNINEYFMLLPFLWFGILIFSFMLYCLMYGDK